MFSYNVMMRRLIVAAGVFMIYNSNLPARPQLSAYAFDHAWRQMALVAPLLTEQLADDCGPLIERMKQPSSYDDTCITDMGEVSKFIVQGVVASLMISLLLTCTQPPKDAREFKHSFLQLALLRLPLGVVSSFLLGVLSRWPSVVQARLTTADFVGPLGLSVVVSPLLGWLFCNLPNKFFASERLDNKAVTCCGSLIALYPEVFFAVGMLVHAVRASRKFSVHVQQCAQLLHQVISDVSANEEQRRAAAQMLHFFAAALQEPHV